MYTEKGSFGISISHLWTDYWIDFVAWPMISFCSDEPGVTAHICIRSYKTGRSLPHIYILSPTQTIHVHNKGNPSKIPIDLH